jgi:large subunit ribosomal protein L4
MAQITLKTTQGADAGNVELDDAVFGIQPNVPVMHQVVTAQLARRRAGTQSTKTRSEVRGGGAKPYRQKGTGNARQGSTNSPHYTGGGIALGPKPRSYAQRTPKKMIKLATRSALSDRASEGKVLVIDSWGFDAPKTKDAKAALAALGVTGRSLVVVDSWESPVALSFRNLPEVQLIKVGELNAYDILCNDWIVFEQGQLPTADTLVTTRSASRATAADTASSDLEPDEHTQDAAEGAPDAGTDEPPPAVHPQEPAEGSDEIEAPEAATDVAAEAADETSEDDA